MDVVAQIKVADKGNSFLRGEHGKLQCPENIEAGKVNIDNRNGRYFLNETSGSSAAYNSFVFGEVKRAE